MISDNKVYGLVEEHIKRLSKRTGSKSRSYSLIPKKAEVIDTTIYGEELGYTIGKTRTERGKLYPHWLLQRAVFRPAPIVLDGKFYYVEIKGYGANGRYLFPTNHTEGDLHFGMYFDIAKKEYDFLKVSMEIPDLISQKAVSLLKFQHKEFVRQCIRGLVSFVFNGRLFDGADTSSLIQQFGETEEIMAENLYRVYQADGLTKVVEHLEPLKGTVPDMLRDFTIITKPAGYLVRLTKAPFRIAGGKKLGIDDDSLNEAAFEAGRLYASMLKKGYIHQVPSDWNITIAGELIDLEDMDKVTSLDELRKSWRFMASQFSNRVSVQTFQDYIELTLGKEFLGEFVDRFLEGSGLGDTSAIAARNIIDMHRESFKLLLEERVNI